jgi:hypothetical protein
MVDQIPAQVHHQAGLGAVPAAVPMELAEALRGIALHQLGFQALRVGATS